MKQQGHETEGVKSRSKGTFYPFVFTGKERDSETGYGYFGARYMDHELMTMWLSVDPLADKYPSICPYAYCALNPVKIVDPDPADVPRRAAGLDLQSRPTEYKDFQSRRLLVQFVGGGKNQRVMDIAVFH